MRFTTIAISGAFAALAVAQSSAASENPSPVQSLSPAQSSTLACLEDCADDDLNCQAHCVHVPSVNEDQANANTECSRECDQGDGSPEQTEAFGRCLADCVNEHYYVTSSGTPEPTGAAGSGSGNNSDDDEATTTGGAAGGSNTSESSPDATESGDSDDSDAAESSATDSTESGTSQTSGAPTPSESPEEEEGAASALVGSGIFALVAAILAL